MRRIVGLLIAGVVLVAYLATDFSVRPMSEVPRDQFEAVWAPVVSTDCDTWAIRQADAALADIWSHVDYMTIDLDSTQYVADDVIQLPYDYGGRFTFRFHNDQGQIYVQELSVRSIC